jgi:hypothetical protein
MKKPSIAQLRTVFKNKGYTLNSKVWELNLIGIRNDKPVPNSFDDLIGVLFKDRFGEDTLSYFSATTDPGTFWLLSPMQVEGCIIMKEGQYKNAYKIGLHKGYKALEQCGDINYVRDNNRDAIPDYNTPKQVKGNYKTNIHHASMPENSIRVDKWSAGCQVINKGWLEFLELCEESKKVTGKNVFSYTLLNSKDFMSRS